VVDLALEHHDLAVIDLDEVPERLDSHGVRVPELHLVEQALPASPEHVM
jgi:hypothetical protein